MSRRSVISNERVDTQYFTMQNATKGAVLSCAIIDVCGAHNPTTQYIKMEFDSKGDPTKGFYSSGIRFILYDLTNKNIISVPWRKSYDELRTIYGSDENIKGRRVDLHCTSQTEHAIENGFLHWPSIEEILFEDESTKGYISLAGVAGITVNDYESQINAHASPGVGVGRKWNRV